MSPCAFCGRENDEASRFCIDCGKPLSPSAARARSSSTTPVVAAGSLPTALASAAHGGSGSAPVARPAAMPAPVDLSLPVCPHCGNRAGLATPVTGDAGTVVFSSSQRTNGPRLSLLDEAGNPTRSFVIESGDLTVGRAAGDVVFADDDFLSPIHAQFSWRAGRLVVRDLGSRNGSWVFLDAPHRLVDGDVLLIGSQLVRFRRLGYPGPRPPEADQTRRMGSFTPSADVAVLQQLRADGSTRDVFHLSPGRAMLVGRAEGDWVFPYDKTMSARHAEIRSEDAEFIVLDCGSRNGVGLAVRGDRPLREGQRVLLGDHTLRIESL